MSDMEVELQKRMNLLIKDLNVDWTPVTKRRENNEDFSSEPARVEFYDEHAAEYNDDMDVYKYIGPAEAAKNLHKYLKGNLKASILDVGGGTGAVIRELKKLAPYSNADGLDPAAKMLEIGKEEGFYNNIFPQYFVVGSGIEHNSYDAACVSGAFVPGHIQSVAVKELCDIVKPGGFVVISMFSKHMIMDADLKLFRPHIQEMVEEGKIKVVEDYQFDNYFTGGAGTAFVLSKN